MRLNDQVLAERARSAFESDDAFRDGVMEVQRSQFRALHNTANLCGTVKELRKFVQSRAGRREAANQEQKAAFWHGLHSALGQLHEEIVDPVLSDCQVPEPDSSSIRHGTFDRRTGHLLIARRFVEHLATHAQYVNARSS